MFVDQSVLLIVDICQRTSYDNNPTCCHLNVAAMACRIPFKEVLMGLSK
jgi:hypothetical protein